MSVEQHASKKTKGELTAERVLDAGEYLFATHGYEGTTLRQIAQKAGIREPGLYNHFSNKQSLYEAVLERALRPMADGMSNHLNAASDLRHYTDLPGLMTDLLLDHPQIPALFQQAMQGDRDSVGNRLLHNWLENLFSRGLETMEEMGGSEDQNPAALAINVIAMFNITTGYFLSQRAFETMAEGDLKSPENIAHQKRLLRKVIRAMLIS